MIAVLASAVRQVVRGKRYELGPAVWSPSKHSTLGWLAVQPVTLKLELPLVDLPVVPTSGSPTTDVDETTDDEAEVEDLTLDTSDAVAGDGTLHAGET
jgi:hypothetical protein